jgi:signal transduction histidine kinase
MKRALDRDVFNGNEAVQSVTERARELLIRSEHDDQQVRITATGCGIGFSADNADQLFNTFTTKSDGLGMGLSICRSIIELHGGRIWAEPHAPNGATIHFTLPLDSGAPLARSDNHLLADAP